MYYLALCEAQTGERTSPSLPKARRGPVTLSRVPGRGVYSTQLVLIMTSLVTRTLGVGGLLWFGYFRN